MQSVKLQLLIFHPSHCFLSDAACHPQSSPICTRPLTALTQLTCPIRHLTPSPNPLASPPNPLNLHAGGGLYALCTDPYLDDTQVVSYRLPQEKNPESPIHPISTDPQSPPAEHTVRHPSSLRVRGPPPPQRKTPQAAKRRERSVVTTEQFALTPADTPFPMQRSHSAYSKPSPVHTHRSCNSAKGPSSSPDKY